MGCKYTKTFYKLSLPLTFFNDIDVLQHNAGVEEIDSDCLDAERMVAELSARNTIELLQKLEEVIAHGNQLMERGGYFAEDEGVFWGVIETRPYMRVRYQYIQILKECGMIRKAVSECEDLLRLCENDNMGVRYMLMHLYVMLEMEEPMLQLYEKYGSYEETQMLFPLSILYFKLGDFEKSAEYLKRLYQVNPDIKQLVKMVLEGDAPDEIDGLESFGYQPGSMGELVVEFEENYGLFSHIITSIQYQGRVRAEHHRPARRRQHHPVHRPLPQGDAWLDGRSADP